MHSVVKYVCDKCHTEYLAVLEAESCDCDKRMRRARLLDRLYDCLDNADNEALELIVEIAVEVTIA